MNINLGFQFQNGLIKMLKESARTNTKYYLKVLDIKNCNINQMNMSLIHKLIGYTNG